MNFPFDEDKALSIFLYIAKRLEAESAKVDLHKIFKIIYFADKKHLLTYGRPVLLGDNYIAMKDGPVPSRLYDIAKIVRGDGLACGKCRDYSIFFNVIGHYVYPKTSPDLDELSASDIECLEESTKENINLTFSQLRDKSHDAAYAKATKDSKIYLHEIAKAAGLSSGMQKYLSAKIEAESAFK